MAEPFAGTGHPPAPVGRAALAEAIATHQGRLHALAVRLLGDHHAAEDAVQEACLRALVSLARFRGDASMETWLYRITANVCLDELRRQQRLACPPTDNRELADPTDLAEVVVRRADLGAALAALPRSLRDVVLLADVWGLDHGEAAAALGIPAGTVASRLHRARLAVRHALTPSLKPSTHVASSQGLAA